VPYLPIDPADIGRDYETDVIRINSQSGKGGIGYILETQFKLDLPTKMREVFGYYIKNISDREHRELTPEEIRDIFMSDFTNVETPLDVCQTSFGSTDGGQVEGEVEVSLRGTTQIYAVEGIGGLNCVSKAIKLATGLDFALESYFEHAVDERSTSTAASYVSISIDEKIYWGAGLDSDIFLSSVKALVSAVNALLSDQNENNR
jgi:2-isopropylmalate synthase